MPKRRGPFSDISWFQVIASVLAAVTAAWIASKLGVAGTLVGVALGSLVATLSAAFYNQTLHRGRTLLVQTEHGTVVEHEVEPNQVSAALDDASAEGGRVLGAKFIDDQPRLHWKTIIATTVIVLALANAAIFGYELVAGHPIGDSGGGTSIGDTFGSGPTDKPTQQPSPSATTPAPTTAPTSVGTPSTAPTPSATTPTLPTFTTPTDTLPTAPTDPSAPQAPGE